MKSVHFIIGLSLLVMLTTACSWITTMFSADEPSGAASQLLPFALDGEFTVSGIVTGTISDCAFDGICALILNVDGDEINAIWAEGMLQCQGQYDGEIAVGETVEVFGIARDANSLSICPSANYYISR